MAPRKKPATPDVTRQVMETFRKPFNELHGLRQDAPSCFNGIVRIRRYRVTAELIEEPVEVLAERLQALWENTDNHHHCDPLRQAARQIGYALRGDMGAAVKKGGT